LTILLVEQSIARAHDFADGLQLIRAGWLIKKVPASDRRRITNLVRLTLDRA